MSENVFNTNLNNPEENSDGNEKQEQEGYNLDLEGATGSEDGTEDYFPIVRVERDLNGRIIRTFYADGSVAEWWVS